MLYSEHCVDDELEMKWGKMHFPGQHHLDLMHVDGMRMKMILCFEHCEDGVGTVKRTMYFGHYEAVGKEMMG